MRTRVLANLVVLSGLLIGSFSATTLAYAANTSLEGYPSTLPTAVKNEISSAVDVQYRSVSGAETEQASGVKISPEITISAGHEFLITGSISGTTNNSCRSLYIYSTGDKNSDNSTDKSIIATYNQAVPSSTDISLIDTSGDSQFNKLAVPEIGSVPNLGNRVFFVNYEPDSNLIQRNPNSSASDITSKSNSLPAIYVGVILANNGGNYLVATGIQSYGQGIPDEVSRPGASGGPIFNQSGQLIGIVKSIYEQQFTAADVSSMYDVNLGNIPQFSQLQLEEVQPVTQNLVTQYSNMLKTPAGVISSVNDTAYCAHPEKQQVKPKSFVSKVLTAMHQRGTQLLAVFNRVSLLPHIK